MRISDVERLVGLSKKAIRLYESRGLFTVERVANGYRSYSEENVETLKQIKLLRLAGVSISDIKLWRYGVLTLEEILDKRKKELAREYGEHSAQCDFCKTLLGQLDGGAIDCTYRLEENEGFTEPSGVLSVGIDIGTTTISASVIDHASKRQIESYTLPNHFNLQKEHGFCEQDAEGILQRVKKLLDHILDSYKSVGSIGITGQMHGIVYVDALGVAVSSLITWEDKRADLRVENGETYCERIQRLSGEEIYTGYGFATHYYMQENGEIPKDAVTFCTIMDYCVMRLVEASQPLVHATNAASFGFYDAKADRFKTEQTVKVFGDAVTVPAVAKDFFVAGTYRDVPVAVAIGDNQAAFLGSVQDLDGGALVNIGTGSQISMLCTEACGGYGLELRPFFAGRYLLCGAALCGGSAYAMLERFFRAYCAASGEAEAVQYETMNRIAKEAYESGVSPLSVDTTFCGTRKDPTSRGGISGIGMSDFTPAGLILGTIYGMCRELYTLYRQADVCKRQLVISGGAVQKNKVLQSVIAEQFCTVPVLSMQIEEAAKGAALFSAVAAGLLSDMSAFSDYIFYKEGEKKR